MIVLVDPLARKPSDISVEVANPVVRRWRRFGEIEFDRHHLSQQVAENQIAVLAQQPQIVLEWPPKLFLPVHVMKEQLVTKGTQESNLCVV